MARALRRNRVAAVTAFSIVSLGLSLLVAACGDGSGGDEVELTSCPRLGDPEVSCRFDGLWSDQFAEPHESSVRVTTTPSGGIHLSIGPNLRRPTYTMSSASSATDTTFTGNVRVALADDWVQQAGIEVVLLDGGATLRLDVVEGPALTGVTFDGVYAGE